MHPATVATRQKHDVGVGRSTCITATITAYPMMILSHFSISFSITVILEDTLEPPTMATKGRLGADTAPSR